MHVGLVDTAWEEETRNWLKATHFADKHFRLRICLIRYGVIMSVLTDIKQVSNQCRSKCAYSDHARHACVSHCVPNLGHHNTFTGEQGGDVVLQADT